MSRLLAQQAILSLSLLLVFAVLALPVMVVLGESSLVWLALAAIVCFLPTSMALLLQSFWVTPRAAVVGVIVGVLLRLVFVICVMLAMAVGRPEVSLRVFAVELSIFYLVSLAVETRLLLADVNRRYLQ